MWGIDRSCFRGNFLAVNGFQRLLGSQVVKNSFFFYKSVTVEL
jgi:hypothetical protein